MKTLFTVSAVIEVGAGLALLLAPSAAAALLFGTPLEAPAGITLVRVAGGALLALGVGSWVARSGPAGPHSAGMIAALLVYNIAAVVLFAYAKLGYGAPGPLLWFVVGLHAAMTLWCLVCLRSVSANGTIRA